MTHAAPDPRLRRPAFGLSSKERDEVLFGRVNWTVADYLEEGRREFDRNQGRGQFPNNGREHYARAFLNINCPPAKLPGGVVPSIVEGLS